LFYSCLNRFYYLVFWRFAKCLQLRAGRSLLHLQTRQLCCIHAQRSQHDLTICWIALPPTNNINHFILHSLLVRNKYSFLIYACVYARLILLVRIVTSDRSITTQICYWFVLIFPLKCHNFTTEACITRKRFNNFIYICRRFC